MDIFNITLESQTFRSGEECHFITEKQRLSVLFVSFAEPEYKGINSIYLWGIIYGVNHNLCKFLHLASMTKFQI